MEARLRAPEAATPTSSSQPPVWALPGLLALFALVAGLYSVTTPIFETPDEIWHYAFIQHVATGQGLPISAANTQALWRQQGVLAPGYYLAAAALTAWIDQSDFPAFYARANPHRGIGQRQWGTNLNYQIHHADEQWPWRGSILALHLARFFSVTLGAITLWAGYRGVALLTGPWPALVGTAVMAFIPQFVFISAAASNDNAVNALASLVLWQLIALTIAPPTAADRARRFAWLGVLLGLAALSKLSSLGLIGLAGLVILGLAWRGRSWRVILDAAIWVAPPAAAIGGWWYARNWLLYGDPLAWNIWQANILLRAERAGWATILGEKGSLFLSFWGLFGWMNVPYPAWVYRCFVALTILIVAGALPAVWRHRRRLVRLDAAGWAAALLPTWSLALFVSWVRFMVIAPAAQGRYFFPAAPALVWLVAVGCADRRARPLGWTAAGCLALLSLVTPGWIIIPAYTPPPLAVSVPAHLMPVDVAFADGIELVGMEAAPATLLPGEVATVTLAWRATATPGHDYSIFVHLVDEDGLIIGQRDTMPGGGLSPTGGWRPGELRVEEYGVQIPATAYTPNRGHWAVGLYDAYAPDQPRLAITAATGAAIRDRAVRFGAAAIAVAPGSVPNAVDAAFADNVTLAGYTFNRRLLHPGDVLTVTLYWRTRGPVQGDYTTFVHLLDRDRRMFGGHDERPAPPTTDWTPGAVVAITYAFTVPPETPPGAYQIELGLYTRPDFDRLTLLTDAGAVGADRLLIGPLRVE